MKNLKKKIRVIVITVFGAYIALCTGFYFFQEWILLVPYSLDKEYIFDFGGEFEELNIPASDGTMINGLLFKTDSSTAKSLIFYLHGNASNLSHWGNIADIYTQNGYDIFMMDYRGFGKKWRENR